MKTAIITVVILMTASVVLATAGDSNSPSIPKQAPPPAAQKPVQPQSAAKPVMDSNTQKQAAKQIKPAVKKAAEPNAVHEPNDPNAAMAKLLAEIEKAIQKLDRIFQNETREWLAGESEKKTNLMKAVQESGLKELELVRETAASEGAVKTVATIDKLVESKKDRFQQLQDKAEEAKKRQIRLKAQEEEKERQQKMQQQAQRSSASQQKKSGNADSPPR